MSNSSRRQRRAEARALAKKSQKLGLVEGQGAAGSNRERDPQAVAVPPVVREKRRRKVEGAQSSSEGQSAVARLWLKAEVAAHFRVHYKTIETWCRRYGLPCLTVGGAVRFDISDVLRWASARKEGV